jgi:hypothetical protein
MIFRGRDLFAPRQRSICGFLRNSRAGREFPVAATINTS